MPERKQIVHYCVKCGKGMSYREKKMLYIYDVVQKNRGNFKVEKAVKRMAFNLCEDCCEELENVILKWKGSGVN